MKQPYYIRYSSEVPKSPLSGSLEGANLSYVAIPQLDPNSPTGNISIVDSSFTFPENTVLFANNVIQFKGNYGISNTNNILVTNQYNNTIDPDKLTPTNKTLPVSPLWYQYLFLPLFPLSPNPNGTYTVSMIDNNGNVIPDTHYQIFFNGSTPVGIYTDIINTIPTWYQLVYMSNGIQVTKLLSAEPIFNAVSTFSGAANEYIVQYNSSLNIYEVLTNGNPAYTYSILNIGTTKINVQHPVEATSTEPWYVQITNGYFKRFVNGNTYQYFVPEYYTQAFTPYLPSQYVIQESPIFMNNNLLRLRQIPLLPIGTITNDVVIYIRSSEDRSDTVNQAIDVAGGQPDFAPDTPIQPVVLSSKWYRLQIEDIDRTTGLVRISGVVDPTGNPVSNLPDDNVIYNNDNLVAFYYYNETDLIYNKISLNPLFDQPLLTQGISLYLTPAIATVTNGGITTTYQINAATTNSVNFLRFDQNEVIIEASDPNVVTGQTLTNFYSTSDGSGIPLLTNDRTTFLELARVFARNVNAITDITTSNLVDTRIVGGSLMPNLPPEVITIINRNTNGMYYLTDWAGSVLPGNSVITIKVPLYLLNDNYTISGNMLSGDNLQARMIDIRRTCKKHIATGALVLLRFYDQYGNIRFDLDPPLDRIWF